MRALVENFSNPSFGIGADVVHIVTAKNAIRFAVKAHDPGYTNAAGANGNLPLQPKRPCTAPRGQSGNSSRRPPGCGSPAVGVSMTPGDRKPGPAPPRLHQR